MRRRPVERKWVPEPGWLRPEAVSQGDHVGPGFLLLVTALAAVARLYRLGFQPFWVDEEMTWSMIRPGAGLGFWEQVRDQIQGPLYLAVVWPLARLGFSEAWLRLPAALAGIVAVPVTAGLAQRLIGGRTARLAALALAVSPFHLWYSQEARGYSFLMLFAAASSLAFMLLAERPSGRRALLYALLGAGVAWSNLSGLFLLGAQAVTALAVVRPRSARERLLWLGAYAAIAAAAAPWLLRASGILAVGRIVPGAATGEALRGATTFTPLAVPFTLFAFFFGYSLGPSLAELHRPDRLAVALAHWPVLAAAGAVTALVLVAGAARLGRRAGALLGVWIGVPLVVVTVLALRNVKPFNPRYLAAVFPLLLVVAAHGLAALPRRVGRLAGFALLSLFLWSLYNYQADPRYAKEDLRDAAVWIAGRCDPGEPVLVPVVERAFTLYFPGPGAVVGFWEVPPIASPEQARAVLSAKMGAARHGFLVLSRTWDFDPRGLLPGALAGEARVEAEMDFPGARVFEWRRGPAGAAGAAEAGR